jgi:hypothetical protein
VLALSFEIHLTPLLRIPFHNGGIGFLAHLGKIPGITPGKGLAFGIIGVIHVPGKGAGIGLQILIIRSSFANIYLMVTGTVFVQGLFAVHGDNLDLDICLGKRGLDGLGHIHGG